jgi:amidase
METCLLAMKEQGAELVDPVELFDESKLGKSEYEVLLYEFKADLNAYLAALGPDAPVHSLEQIIQFNEAQQARVMPYFGQERMIKAQAKGPLTQKRYQNALRRNLRLSRQEGIDAMLQKYRLQAIVAPTGGPAWLIDLVTGDRFSGGGFSSLAALAGYPHISVPAGYIFGLPVGISFFASAWQESTLVRLAFAFEQATQVRCPPQFLPSVNLRQGKKTPITLLEALS